MKPFILSRVHDARGYNTKYSKGTGNVKSRLPQGSALDPLMPLMVTLAIENGRGRKYI